MQHAANGMDRGYFPRERLAAYGLAREMVRWAAARKARLRGLPGEAGPQLERAVVGAHTNLCAGASARGAEAKRHFRIALSEAGEAGGCLDLALDLGAIDRTDHERARACLLRLCACLCGLAR